MSSFTESKKVIDTNTIDLPSRSNQDRGTHFNINGTEFWIIADGHGSSGGKFADLSISFLTFRFNDESLNLEIDDLTETLNLLCSELNDKARELFGDLRGGNTLSILIKRENDFWLANLGDSAIALIDLDESHKFEILSEDHGASNLQEAKRILEIFPDTIFEYDRIKKHLPVMPLYSKEENEIVRIEPSDMANFYIKNRMSEAATYVGYDSTNKMALTRGIGDFSFQEKMGLSCLPYVRRFEIAKPTQIILLASDGFWDCWTHDEIVEFFKTRDVKELEQTHRQKAQQYFGSSKDDSFIHVISIA